MIFITAPEPIITDGKTSVFLAGGITNCPWWQDEIIDLLDNGDDFVVFNPRRRNFPIHDPNAAQEQIEWEYNALNISSVFSMWFCNADSDQPICMYELGRHLALKHPDNVVVGVEPGYRREQDVRIQTELVSTDVYRRISTSLDSHAKEILNALDCFGDGR